MDDLCYVATPFRNYSGDAPEEEEVEEAGRMPALMHERTCNIFTHGKETHKTTTITFMLLI